jgi:hypothetical protein
LIFNPPTTNEKATGNTPAARSAFPQLRHRIGRLNDASNWHSLSIHAPCM